MIKIVQMEEGAAHQLGRRRSKLMFNISKRASATVASLWGRAKATKGRLSSLTRSEAPDKQGTWGIQHEREV
jgi:hypothetical protein